jgi:hypothetical protein
MRTVPVAVAFAVLALAVACVGIAQLMPRSGGAHDSMVPAETPAASWNEVRRTDKPRSDAASADRKTPAVPAQPVHQTRPV